MAKPVILAVDDDDLVLRAVERDLRARYAAGYRIVAADSGTAALEATRQLTARGASVALFLVDQRMPVMTGIEFLRQAVELQPDAKRVLLTAYADTEVAIQAINEIRLDQYLLKPWDPPRGTALPGRRRPARGLVGRLPPDLRGRSPARRPMVATRSRDPRLPGP